MPRPQLRSGSHTSRLRRRVPADLVTVVGNREVILSLKTKDPAEAKRLMAEELVKLETRWATLRRGPQTLSEGEAHEIAGAVHDAWLTRHADEPSAQTFWPVDVGGSPSASRSAASAWPSSASSGRSLASVPKGSSSSSPSASRPKKV